jgi:type I restriction enzyme S subunit
MVAKATGASYPAVSDTIVREAKLPKHTAEKRVRIVSTLSKAKEIIEHRRAQLAKLDELVKCRFVEMFGEPLEVLKQGKTQALGTLVKEITVGYVGEAASAYTDIGIPYLRTQNVRSGYIDFAGLIYVTELFHTSNTKSKVSPGDVVISRVGVNRGMAAKIPDSLPEANIANCLIIKKSDAFNSDYLIFYLNLSYGKHPQFGASVGSAQGVINTAILKKWQVLQPELEQQNTFAAFVQRIDKLRFVVETSHNHKHFTIYGLVYLYANPRLNLGFA